MGSPWLCVRSFRNRTGIFAESALSTVYTAIFATFLTGMLHITSITLLWLWSSSFRFCTPLRVRVSCTMIPLLKSRLITNSKRAPATASSWTFLVRRVRNPDLMDFPLPTAVLNLLDMYYKPWQVHAIMEHCNLTLFLQFRCDPCKEPAHLIHAVQHKRSGISWQIKESQGIIPCIHRALLKVNELLNLSLFNLSRRNLSIKVVLNNSHMIGPLPNAFLSHHILQQDFATSLSWYEANSVFSISIVPISTRIFWTSSTNS